MRISRPPRPIPGVLYVPYVECPRVEKPPAKNMIARTIRMMRSKTGPPFCSRRAPDIRSMLVPWANSLSLHVTPQRANLGRLHLDGTAPVRLTAPRRVVMRIRHFDGPRQVSRV